MRIPKFEGGVNVDLTDPRYYENYEKNLPDAIRKDLRKPMNDADPLMKELVMSVPAMRAARVLGKVLDARRLKQMANIYRKVRQGNRDIENYTGKNLRPNNMAFADREARRLGSAYGGQGGPIGFLYDELIDPAMNLYTKMQSHPILGPLIPF